MKPVSCVQQEITNNRRRNIKVITSRIFIYDHISVLCFTLVKLLNSFFDVFDKEFGFVLDAVLVPVKIGEKCPKSFPNLFN